MPRIAAITASSNLPREQQYAADKVLQVFGHIRGPFSVLLHSPALAEQLLPLVTFVRQANTVEPRLRFVGILTAVRESAADYVWAAQVEQARKHGIREDVIALIRRNGDPSALQPDERDIMIFVQQLVRTKRVEQSAYDALQSRHDAQWMVELVAIANFFVFVSGICNAFEVPPPVGGDSMGAPSQR
jgi:4-carboxymuconolactone decarboxylase